MLVFLKPSFRLKNHSNSQLQQGSSNFTEACRTRTKFSSTIMSPHPHYLHSFFQRSLCLLGCTCEALHLCFLRMLLLFNSLSNRFHEFFYFSGCKIFVWRLQGSFSSDTMLHFWTSNIFLSLTMVFLVEAFGLELCDKATDIVKW